MAFLIRIENGQIDKDELLFERGILSGKLEYYNIMKMQ